MILLVIFVLSASEICSGFTPEDHYLLSCGTSVNSADDVSFDRRTWFSDQNTTFSPLSSLSTTIPAVAKHDFNVDSNPFSTARIFISNFTYTFPVSPGPKFVRLYFYPTLYSHQYDASQFFISVQANDHLLLRNYSAQLSVNYAPFTASRNFTPNPYVIKEYYVSVPDGETYLNLTFSPTPPSVYAFINGIEVVSVPERLYITNEDIENVESPTPFSIPKSAALEMAYRINVGGPDVYDGEESGMYRQWKDDTPYIFSAYFQSGKTSNLIKYSEKVPNYSAPPLVYSTFNELDRDSENLKLNLTWRFMVDPNFTYLTRLHWCEVDYHINVTGDREFSVYINSFTAEYRMDILFETREKYVPYYKDYVVRVPQGNGGGGSEDIWIALHPNAELLSKYHDVLLNGLEIFKISNVDGSLDAPNPHVTIDKTTSQSIIDHPKRPNIHLAIIGGLVASILLITLMITCLLIYRRSKGNKESSVHGKSKSESGSKTASHGKSTLPSHRSRQFSLAEIRLATDDFNEGLIIGYGGFGNVYKGVIGYPVAIKRLKASSKQGVHEFRTEIELLSKLQHMHLVSLIGFCYERGEMILVYEYMDRGTLRDHLYNTNNPPLSWTQRVNACLGAAKGLHYLHFGATSNMIIHRDVKSTNILLDKNWVAKVSDFGLSKLGSMGEDLSHVSTVVKGSIGYLDVEYIKNQRLTEKSDVYSFGVVLFEVLCGRLAVDPNLSKEKANLAMWARTHQQKGTLDLVVDPNIKDEIAPSCLRKFGEIAVSCVHERGTDRPSMADLIWSLEFVLDLQLRADDTWSNDKKTMIPFDTITTNELPIDTNDSSHTITCNGIFNFSGERMTRTNSSSALVTDISEDYYGEPTSVSVFSEILKPSER